MALRNLAAVFVALAAVCGANAQIPVALEGQLTNVETASRTITVMGVPIHVPTSAVIHSPTATLTFDQLAGLPLPGLSQPGFVGGIAVVTGEKVGATVEASDVFVQPGENVLGGPVTGTGTSFSIFGRAAVLLTDARMPGSAVNDFGFPVNLKTAAVDAPATASGYVGQNGVFYAHGIICDAAKLVIGFKGLNVTKALAPAPDRLDVRGACSALAGTVRLYDDVTGVQLASSAVSTGPYYGTFRFDLRGLTSLPVRVRVSHTNGSSDTEPVL